MEQCRCTLEVVRTLFDAWEASYGDILSRGSGREGEEGSDDGGELHFDRVVLVWVLLVVAKWYYYYTVCSEVM